MQYFLLQRKGEDFVAHEDAITQARHGIVDYSENGFIVQFIDRYIGNHFNLKYY